MMNNNILLLIPSTCLYTRSSFRVDSTEMGGGGNKRRYPGAIPAIARCLCGRNPRPRFNGAKQGA